MDNPPAAQLREIRERMDSLDGRVRKIEEENDSAGAAILNAEKDIRSIKETLGEPPSEKRPGSGLTRDVSELKGQIGHAPNEGGHRSHTGAADKRGDEIQDRGKG